MFCIRIADVVVEIKNRYEYTKQLCVAYEVSSGEQPLFSVEVTEDEILKEQQISSTPATAGYAESVCIYRKICKQLLLKSEAYLFHSAVIEYEGNGYVFAAKSGTGKSTHAMLWRKAFGERVHVVNGDKPIFRFQDGKLVAYGTPWCGKEGWEENRSVTIKGICFLERARENTIRRITPQEATTRMFHQILLPDTTQCIDILFPLLDRTVTQVPVYLLGCNISEEAAQVAYVGMNLKDMGDRYDH